MDLRAAEAGGTGAGGRGHLRRGRQHLGSAGPTRWTAITAARCPKSELNRRGARPVWPTHVCATLNECTDGRCTSIADSPVQWHDAALVDSVRIGAGLEQSDNGFPLCVWVPVGRTWYPVRGVRQ